MMRRTYRIIRGAVPLTALWGVLWAAGIGVPAGGLFAAGQGGGPWKRHVIDASSKGADGVRLADVNGDGLADIVTGWEEGGVVRVYLHPGRERVRQPWPTVTVGRVDSPEDAVFVDLDGDGAIDVVSSCEGRNNRMYVHWAPKNPDEYLLEDAWKTETLPGADGRARWMFALPMRLGGRGLVDLAAGAKDKGAQIGWFESPENPRRLGEWRWHPLYDAGWVMSLVAADMDGDGHLDILASDRYGPRQGTLWLRNPGPGEAQRRRWEEVRIGASGEQVMFLTTADLDGDGLTDVLTAAKPRRIFVHRRLDASGRAWKTHEIALPDTAGTAKAVAVGDIDLDGKLDLVFTCEQAMAPLSGVMWMSYRESVFERGWQAHDISGPEGVKYDLVQLVDLDGDGDLDVLTCEESENLGVVWYENPARSGSGSR